MNKSVKQEFFDWLKTLNSSMIKMYALQEGSLVFPKVPILTIEGPLGLGILLEGPLISLSSFSTLISTNAAIMTITAGKQTILYEYGFRRAQSPGAALFASKYSFLGGFNSTSNLMAAAKYNIPLTATISHAFVTSFRNLSEIEEYLINGIQLKQRALYYRKILQFEKTSESELASFLALAKSQPEEFLCLVDSFDTLTSGIPNFLIVAFSLMDAGFFPVGIRLDSGDLAKLSLKSRDLFVQNGLKVNKSVSDFKIMASNNIGVKELEQFSSIKHSIDIFAIEQELTTCESTPHLGVVYKLVEISGLACLKFSENIEKSTLPLKKIVYRVWVSSSPNHPTADIIALANENLLDKKEIKVLTLTQSSERYIIIPSKIIQISHLVWDEGNIVHKFQNLTEAREHCKEQLNEFNHGQLRKKKRYLVLLTENYWDSFQKASEQQLIPRILH